MDIPVHQHETRPTRLVALLGLFAAIALFEWLALSVFRSVPDAWAIEQLFPKAASVPNW